MTIVVLVPASSMRFKFTACSNIFFPSPSVRLTNNDLLSLDPLGPALPAGSASTVSSAAGNLKAYNSEVVSVRWTFSPLFSTSHESQLITRNTAICLGSFVAQKCANADFSFSKYETTNYLSNTIQNFSKCVSNLEL